LALAVVTAPLFHILLLAWAAFLADLGAKLGLVRWR
jgi:hypothetical protein